MAILGGLVKIFGWQCWRVGKHVGSSYGWVDEDASKAISSGLVRIRGGNLQRVGERITLAI